jgi:hypothetical protein
VYGSGRHADALRERAAAAQHDVARRRREPADRPRIERQQPPETALVDAEAIERRGVNVVRCEAPVGARLVVQQREDRRARIHLGDRRKRPLGAAHHQQIIVSKSDVDAGLRPTS